MEKDYITLKEYFKAKGIDIDTLPMLSKSSTGLREHSVFHGGIMARMLPGKPIGKIEGFLPEEAKQINKLLGATVFNYMSGQRISMCNNNCNKLLFEELGDAIVLWTLPIVDNIVEMLSKGIQGQWKSASYVGYSTMCTFKHVMEGQPIPGLDKPLALKCIEKIDSALTSAFLIRLTNNLNLQLVGHYENTLYFEDPNGVSISLAMMFMPGIENLKPKRNSHWNDLIQD